MTQAPSAGESVTPAVPDVRSLQLDLLDANPAQPRKTFSAEGLESLSQSIKADGLIQPIVARPSADGRFEIIAGERRWRAAQKAGSKQVPVIVREDMVGKDVLVLQLVENIEREELTLPELSAGVAKLVETIGIDETAARLKKSVPWVSRHAGVLKLPPPVKELVGSGAISSVDVALDLGKLHQLNKQTAERRISEFASAAQPEAYSRAPTRAGIRDDLKRAEESNERKQEQKAELAALREKAKTDPKAAAKLKAKKAAKTPDGRKELEKQIKTFEEEAQTFLDDMIAKLYSRLAMPKPSRGKFGYSHDLPLRISAPSLSAWSGPPPPSSMDVAHFGLHADGNFDEISAIARLLNPETALQVRFSGVVTLIEAKKLEAVLGRRVRFSFDDNRTGKKLKALVERPSNPSAGKKPTKAAAAAKPEVPKDAGPGNGASEVAAFLKARVKKSAIPTRRISSTDLHAAYITWCKAQGHVAIPLRSNVWAQTIEAAGIERVRSNGIHYVGIELIKS